MENVLQLKRLNRRSVYLSGFPLSAFVFFLLFLSNDTFLFGTNSNEIFVAIPRYLMIILALVAFFLCLYRKLFNKENSIKIWAYLFLIVSFVIVSLFNNENLPRVVIKCLCITCGFLLTLLIGFERFFGSFCKAMAFICFCSIIFTSASYLVPSLIRLFPSIVNTAGARIYTCGFAGVYEEYLAVGFGPRVIIRSTGMFWEPGVFQIFINVAILFELFKMKKRSLARIAIYLIALALTFSTTGYITFGLILLLFYLFKSKAKMYKKIVALTSLTMIVLFLYFLLRESVIFELVFGKLIDNENGSMNVRKASVIINWEIFTSNPLTGIGMERMEEEFLYRSYNSTLIYGSTDQNSNTLLYQLSAHGVFYGLPFIVGTFLFGARFKKGIAFTIGVFMVFFFLYVGENLAVSIFPYFIVFYGFDSLEKKKKEFYGNN